MIESIGEGIHYTVFRVGNKVYKIPMEYMRELKGTGKVITKYTPKENIRYIDEQTLSDIVSAMDFDELMYALGYDGREHQLTGMKARELYYKYQEVIERGRDSVYAARKLAEFGVETKMTPTGILVQEYVEGKRPTFEDWDALETALRQRGIFTRWPVTLDIHRGNFFKTPEGFKIFDYSIISRGDFRRNVKTLEDVVNEETSKTIRNLLRKKSFWE